jgi:GntR family transcriptional regulator, transcriptional repressor for pyruvate dehydrogenase complex
MDTEDIEVEIDMADATAAGRPGLDVGHADSTTYGRADRRRSPKTSERVALEIIHEISGRGLRTGDHLPLEAAMVEGYGVSRASLREALRLLEVQGLIRIKPGPAGGPQVGTVDAANLARTATMYFHLGAATYGQLLRAQALFEPLCAALAAEHPERAAAMEPFLAPPEPHDEAEYREATVGLHNMVYSLAANQVVSLLTQAITHVVSSRVNASMDPVELRPAILEEHTILAAAIAGGRAEEARLLMAEHFEAQHHYYRNHWPSRLDELIESD